MIPPTCCSICGESLVPIRNGLTRVQDIAVGCLHCDVVCTASPPMRRSWDTTTCVVCIRIQRNLVLFSQAVFDPDDTVFPQ